MSTESCYVVEQSCRSCRSTDLDLVLEYGPTPLADRLLTPDEVAAIRSGALTEPIVPLTLVVCGDCSLMQIAETVHPETLFHGAYPYFSSVSPTLRAHFAHAAETYRRRFDLDSKSFVVEIASNDGALLRHFAASGIPVLGIDPAEPPVQAARQVGVPSWCEFFGPASVDRVLASSGPADLVIANNVVAHVAELNAFVESMVSILAPDGTIVIECHDVESVLEGLQYDTVYHQHLCYFSACSAAKLFARHGVRLVDVENIPTYGGSLRLYFSRSGSISDAATEQLRWEITADQSHSRATFANEALALKAGLADRVSELANVGRVAAWGAAAKATTLLAFTGIAESLEYVVDTNPFKHGRFMAGNHLPIVDPSHLAEAPVDDLVILAWNFAAEIARSASQIAPDTRHVIPLPNADLVR